MVDDLKNVGDWAAIGTAFGTIVGWLPEIAAALAIIWTVMRMYIEWPKFKKRCKWLKG